MMLEVKNGDLYITYLMILVSLIPVISMIGHIFTHDGREAMKSNTFLPIYFVIFIIFAYFFWMQPLALNYYLGMSFRIRIIVYSLLCFIPLLQRGLPN